MREDVPLLVRGASFFVATIVFNRSENQCSIFDLFANNLEQVKTAIASLFTEAPIDEIIAVENVVEPC